MNKESNLRLDAKAIETNTGIPEKKMQTKIIWQILFQFICRYW
jgi:hypothetical protein